MGLLSGDPRSGKNTGGDSDVWAEVAMVVDELVGGSGQLLIAHRAEGVEDEQRTGRVRRELGATALAPVPATARDACVVAPHDLTGLGMLHHRLPVSDGVLSAYIPLLEVLPAYQQSGIGAELMRLMLETLSDIYMVDLLCDLEVQPYYERMGMRRATGMLVRNYAAQSGKPA